MENKTNKFSKFINKNGLWLAAVAIPVVIIVLVLINAISYAVNDDPHGVNVEQVVEGIKLSDGVIIQENGIYNYSAKVTNTNQDTTHVEYLKLSLYDNNDNKIVTLYGYVGRDLQPEESTQIYASVDKDISATNDVEVELQK